MLGKLILAFILIPLIEFFLLLWIADKTSIGATLLLVIVTGIAGSLVARRQGMGVLTRFRAALAAGKMPGREIQDGLLIAFAAALLLTPGVLTDLVGFLLLIPAIRAKVRTALARRFAANLRVRTFEHRSSVPPFDIDPSGDVRPIPPGRPDRARTIDAVDVRRVS